MISENIERLIEAQPPGTIGPRLVKLLGIASVGASLITKNSMPTKTFLLGLAAGTMGNSLNLYIKTSSLPL